MFTVGINKLSLEVESNLAFKLYSKGSRPTEDKTENGVSFNIRSDRAYESSSQSTLDSLWSGSSDRALQCLSCFCRGLPNSREEEDRPGPNDDREAFGGLRSPNKHHLEPPESRLPYAPHTCVRYYCILSSLTRVP